MWSRCAGLRFAQRAGRLPNQESVAQQVVFPLPLEPAAEEGGGQALALAVAPGVVNVLACGISLAQEGHRRVIEVLTHNPCEGRTHRELQDA